MIRRFETEPKLTQVRFYGEHDDAYTAGFFVYSEGSVGIINGLLSSEDGFFNNYSHLIPDLLQSLNLRTVRAHMTPVGARLMKAHWSKYMNVSIGEKEAVDGRELVWIEASIMTQQ